MIQWLNVCNYNRSLSRPAFSLSQFICWFVLHWPKNASTCTTVCRSQTADYRTLWPKQNQSYLTSQNKWQNIKRKIQFNQSNNIKNAWEGRVNSLWIALELTLNQDGALKCMKAIKVRGERLLSWSPTVPWGYGSYACTWGRLAQAYGSSFPPIARHQKLNNTWCPTITSWAKFSPCILHFESQALQPKASSLPLRCAAHRDILTSLWVFYYLFHSAGQ